jgi:hypothetical protein
MAKLPLFIIGIVIILEEVREIRGGMSPGPCESLNKV